MRHEMPCRVALHTHSSHSSTLLIQVIQVTHPIQVIQVVQVIHLIQVIQVTHPIQVIQVVQVIQVIQATEHTKRQRQSERVAACCSALQRVAVRCGVTRVMGQQQCHVRVRGNTSVAVCGSVLQQCQRERQHGQERKR